MPAGSELRVCAPWVGKSQACRMETPKQRYTPSTSPKESVIVRAASIATSEIGE
jgi:hypothetical protein